MRYFQENISQSKDAIRKMIANMELQLFAFKIRWFYSISFLFKKIILQILGFF